MRRVIGFLNHRPIKMIRIRMKMTVNLRRKPKEKLRNKWYVFLPPL
jgi:hypothetical protein